MQNVIFSILAVLVISYVVLYLRYRKEIKSKLAKSEPEEPKQEKSESKQKKLNEELAKTCRYFDYNKEDINKVIRLLEAGADPNTKVAISVNYSNDSYAPGYATEYVPLYSETENEEVKRLLRAFGAKTPEELRAEWEEQERIRKAKEAQEYALRETKEKAEKAAKAKADKQRVDAYLAARSSQS